MTKFKKYVSNPRVIYALQITEENIEELVKKQIIWKPVDYSKNYSLYLQYTPFSIGSYLIKNEKFYRILTRRAFEKAYKEVG